jgi:molecular chaperone GrpE
MSKRFKDDSSEYHGESQPIITLTPDSAAHSNPHDSRQHGRGSQGGSTPLSVEETVEVLGELDKLTAQLQELTRELESKNREIAQLKAQNTAADAGVPETGPATSSEIEGDAKDKEIAEFKDKYLRALAENENTRRRIRQQSEDSVRLQKENLLRDLLPIVDNLERAVEAAKGGADGKSIVEGVQMVLASLMDFLKANGVRPMASVGEQFDPNRHEAADQVLHPTHPPNTVVDEFHRGYLISDKVLRPARVVVSKGDGNGKKA